MAPDINNLIPADVLADLEDVARQAASVGVHDRELLRRVQERSRQVREEILRNHGVVDAAVSLIREARDEE